MFRSKTVFVLGAGSSNEVNLPIGSDLIKLVSDSIKINFDVFGRVEISGDQRILNALREQGVGYK